MLEELKKEVYEQNMQLPALDLVEFTWGNVSALARDEGLFVIKPSGVAYDQLSPEDMVVCDLEGNVVEGKLAPSSDTPTHAYLYRHFKEIGGIVHTHSPWAVAFAQAGRDLPALGTTHADTFYGDVLLTRALTEAEVKEAYELNTGKVIVETFEKKAVDPLAVPAVLVKQHGPFTWGKDAKAAVYNAKVLEVAAQMAYHTLHLAKEDVRLPQYLLDKHYYRKHGKDAYYGQIKAQ